MKTTSLVLAVALSSLGVVMAFAPAASAGIEACAVEDTGCACVGTGFTCVSEKGNDCYATAGVNENEQKGVACEPDVREIGVSVGSDQASVTVWSYSVNVTLPG